MTDNHNLARKIASQSQEPEAVRSVQSLPKATETEVSLAPTIGNTSKAARKRVFELIPAAEDSYAPYTGPQPLNMPNLSEAQRASTYLQVRENKRFMVTPTLFGKYVQEKDAFDMQIQEYAFSDGSIASTADAKLRWPSGQIVCDTGAKKMTVYLLDAAKGNAVENAEYSEEMTNYVASQLMLGEPSPSAKQVAAKSAENLKQVLSVQKMTIDPVSLELRAESANTGWNRSYVLRDHELLEVTGLSNDEDTMFKLKKGDVLFAANLQMLKTLVPADEAQTVSDQEAAAKTKLQTLLLQCTKGKILDRTQLALEFDALTKVTRGEHKGSAAYVAVQI